jgi:hypothetical protein
MNRTFIFKKAHLWLILESKYALISKNKCVISSPIFQNTSDDTGGVWRCMAEFGVPRILVLGEDGLYLYTVIHHNEGTSSLTY